MKILSVVLLVLIVSITSSAQKMTDRDLDRLVGKVKVAEVWRKKVGPDVTPVEAPRAMSQTTYDEEGNISTTVQYGEGILKTTYFLVKGERVSKTEWIGEDPMTKVKLPKGVELEKKKDRPFDVKYEYKYDKNRRIAEVIEKPVEGGSSTSVKYVFDDSGRILEAKESTGSSYVNEIIQSFKYDDKGNIAEVTSKSTHHVLKGIGSSPPGSISIDTVTGESSVRYSDHTLDKNGNWTKRTVTGFDSKGKITSVLVDVRYLTYF